MAKVIGFDELIKFKYKATCKNCGAIILFEEEDLKDDFQYNQYCFSRGVCPNCKERVSFNKFEHKYMSEEEEK